jgi:hypothetical protein
MTYIQTPQGESARGVAEYEVRAAWPATLLSARRVSEGRSMDFTTLLLAVADTRSWLSGEKGDSEAVTLVIGQLPQDDRLDPVSLMYLNADPDVPSYAELLTYADLDSLVEIHGHIRASTVKQLRHSVADAARVRFSLAHEFAHGSLPWRRVERSAPALPSPLGVETFSVTARQPATQAVGIALHAQPSVCSGLTLLRFIDGVLAVLRLMLVRVLSALSGSFDAIIFVFAVIATCQRYGRRDEPASEGPLPVRPCLKPPGTVPTAC